jgi:hypothetical protein
MFLYFLRKYNMILFILKILDHMQIKTLNFCLFDFYKSTTYIKKVQTHPHPFLLCFSHTPICNYK